MESSNKLKQHFLEMHWEAIFDVLEKLPDFSMDLNFECSSSFIPFVSNFAPSDTYKIYKQGSNLRLDMTLIGFKNFQSVRGNMTMLFKGRNQGSTDNKKSHNSY